MLPLIQGIADGTHIGLAVGLEDVFFAVLGQQEIDGPQNVAVHRSGGLLHARREDVDIGQLVISQGEQAH